MVKMENLSLMLVPGYIILNLFSFLLMGWDKRLARKKRWRIPEARFFALALLGGAPGVWLGMQFFHHKTKHKQFIFGVPALFLLNLIFVYLIWKLLI